MFNLDELGEMGDIKDSDSKLRNPISSAQKCIAEVLQVKCNCSDAPQTK